VPEQRLDGLEVAGCVEDALPGGIGSGRQSSHATLCSRTSTHAEPVIVCPQKAQRSPNTSRIREECTQPPGANSLLAGI
jgi:hypothetical protein